MVGRHTASFGHIVSITFPLTTNLWPDYIMRRFAMPVSGVMAVLYDEITARAAGGRRALARPGRPADR